MISLSPLSSYCHVGYCEVFAANTALPTSVRRYLCNALHCATICFFVFFAAPLVALASETKTHDIPFSSFI